MRSYGVCFQKMHEILFSSVKLPGDCGGRRRLVLGVALGGKSCLRVAEADRAEISRPAQVRYRPCTGCCLLSPDQPSGLYNSTARQWALCQPCHIS